MPKAFDFRKRRIADPSSASQRLIVAEKTDQKHREYDRER
jgi:hypothetical protein